MIMLSFKQVESDYGKKYSCKRGCSCIIESSHCLNFGYYHYGIIIFWIWTQNGNTRCAHEEKASVKWTAFDNFLRKVNFILMFHFLFWFWWVSFPFKNRKAIFQRSTRLKSQKFPLGVNYDHDTDFSKLVNINPVKKFFLILNPETNSKTT